ncbi:hypothetical protein SAMN05421774_10452 [Gemmobacter megaterium]|uniref:Alpha/beta hydrolase family protein n=2 Tax=Gemmobacter megaterium TaxID=1086013 RepID=A0A1N7NQ51_9RHOB|nr:hypothetical protein SAMN05421774_10452 [Gemmobacter megaterium]
MATGASGGGIWGKMKRATQQGRVARRVVIYIPGFDPFPPRRYRELYRKEGAAQARLSGYDLTLAAAGSGWTVQARIEGAEVETRFEVLVWHDLVQAAMPDGIAATYGQMLRTAWVYFGTGAVWPLLRLRKGPLLAACYPVGMLLGQLALAGGAGWLICLALAVWLPVWLAAVPALVGAWGLLRLFKRWDSKIFAHYLMHDFAYGAALRGAYAPDLERRLAEFGARTRAAMAEDVDEVLVVGHSSGAHLGVSVLADLLREGLPDGPVLSFLTLGQAVPMVSFLPQAQRLRADLAMMAGQGRIPWVDVSAPGDGCTYALCDPAAVTGVAPPDARWPLVLSAAFSQTLSPARRAELKWRFFRLHFQYLCAFDALPDAPDAYEYFRITAGPLTLWDRMGRRVPSPSRIVTPVSRYRDVA